MAIFGVGIGLLCLVLPIIIVVMIIMAIKKNKENKEGKEGESFENIIRTIYIYILIISFLCATIAGFLMFADAAIDYFIPVENEIYDSSLDNMLEKNNDRNATIVNIYTYASVVVVSLPLFVYHSKLVKGKNQVKV